MPKPPDFHHRPSRSRSPRLTAILLPLALVTIIVAFPLTHSRPMQASLVQLEDSATSVFPGLPPCQSAPELFPDDPGDPKALQWQQIFRDTVKGVIDAETVNTQLSCTDNARMPASQQLKDLAAKLPLWRDHDPLYSSDTPAVILDYLETYGCALKAKGVVLPYDMALYAQQKGQPLSLFDFLEQNTEWFDQSDSQLGIATETVRRSLLLLMGERKLDPLNRVFTCFNRASKDLRNILGLLGEASACTPVRTWDALGPLRQLSE